MIIPFHVTSLFMTQMDKTSGLHPGVCRNSRHAPNNNKKKEKRKKNIYIKFDHLLSKTVLTWPPFLLPVLKVVNYNFHSH